MLDVFLFGGGKFLKGEFEEERGAKMETWGEVFVGWSEAGRWVVG